MDLSDRIERGNVRWWCCFLGLVGDGGGLGQLVMVRGSGVRRQKIFMREKNAG